MRAISFRHPSGSCLYRSRSGGYKLGTSGLPAQDLDVTLAYDTSGRLSGVNSGAGLFSYGYVTNSELLSGVTGPQVATTYAYEPNRDVRTEVLNQIGTTTISRYGYRSDGIARRKDRVKEGTAFSAGVYDRFVYNDRNEVTLTRNYTGTNPDGTSDPETVALSRQFSYDAIGNRLTSQSGTSSIRGYTSNALNQYTALTNPSASPVHDLDGNQTQSGTGWYYEWDAENRLTVARDYATSPVNGSKKLEFTYDYQSRRIRKIESSYVSSTWTVLDDRKFIYEGWSLLGEFATSGFARICAYTWGLDLSQTHQGAGGVGGLLAVTTATPSTATLFATYDGNGNVSEYISSTGGIEAHFEYDAFGELSVSTGSNLGRFSHRFSSKYWDSASGFYYYGFRYYNPSTGRWPSRDPMQEQGGVNLYGFVGNEPIDLIDSLGLKTFYGHDLLADGTLPFNEAIPEFLAGKLGVTAALKGVLFWKRVRCCCSGSTPENVGKVRYIATLDNLKLSGKGKVSLTKFISKLAPQKYREGIESLLKISGVNVDVKLAGNGGLKLHYDQCQETGKGGGPIDFSASPAISSTLGTKSVLASELTGSVTLSGNLRTTYAKGVFSVTPQSFSGVANINQEIFVAGESVEKGGGSVDLFTASGPFRSLKINARQWPWTTSVQ